MQAECCYVGQVCATGLLVHRTGVHLGVTDETVGRVHCVQMHHGERGGEDLWGGLCQPTPPPVPPGPVQVQPVHVDPFWRGLGHLLPGHPGDIVLKDDGIQCPALVCPRHFLPHGRQEALGVKEASHPEDVGTSGEYPLVELSVPFQQLSEPEPQRRGFPRHLLPWQW